MATSAAAAAASSKAAARATAYQLEHYGDDRGPALLGACAVCIIFVVVPVALRIYAQKMIRKASALDTWMILIAAALAIGITGCTIAAVHNGLGKHQVTQIPQHRLNEIPDNATKLRVQKEDPHPPSYTLKIFQIGYFVTVLQGAALMFIKLAILVFYRRAFTMRHKAFKFSTWFVGGFSVLLGVAQTIEFILQCIPSSLFWNRIYLILGETPPGPLSGYCMPQTIHLTIPLVLDLVTEIAILILPVIGLWQLQLPKRKKVGLFFAFSLGIFVTAISIIRLVVGIPLEDNGDHSWNDFDSFAWQTVQVCFGVACACVPAMAPLYRLFKQNTSSKGGMLNKYYRRTSTTGRSPFALNDEPFGTPTGNDSMKSLNAHTVPSGSEQDLESGTRDYRYGGTFHNTIVGSKNDKAGRNIQMHGIKVARDVSITTSK